jgi:hypothetical protein
MFAVQDERKIEDDMAQIERSIYAREFKSPARDKSSLLQNGRHTHAEPKRREIAFFGLSMV